MDRKDLKIQALLDKITELTRNYENNIADLRVEVTIIHQENAELQREIERMRGIDAETQEEDTSDYPG